MDGIHDYEELEEINCVSYTYKVKLTDKKTIKDIENYLTYTSLWDNIKIYHFMVEEEVDIFSVEVMCSHEDYPDDFNVAWMVSQLQSLPWPQGYSVSAPMGQATSPNILAFSANGCFLQPPVAFLTVMSRMTYTAE